MNVPVGAPTNTMSMRSSAFLMRDHKSSWVRFAENDSATPGSSKLLLSKADVTVSANTHGFESKQSSFSDTSVEISES